MFSKLQILIQETHSQGRDSCGQGLIREERRGRGRAKDNSTSVLSISLRT